MKKRKSSKAVTLYKVTLDDNAGRLDPPMPGTMADRVSIDDFAYLFPRLPDVTK